MNLAELAEVWTLPSAILAIFSGILFGSAVGWISINPNYSAGIAGPLRIAVIAAVFAASGGLTFYAGQALGSYLSDDPNWHRVMSRYGQWILFSLTIGATTWVLTQRDRHNRRHRAHDLVVGELGRRS